MNLQECESGGALEAIAQRCVSARKMKERWCKDSEHRGDCVSGRWSKYQMEVIRVGMILSV